MKQIPNTTTFFEVMEPQPDAQYIDIVPVKPERGLYSAYLSDKGKTLPLYSPYVVGEEVYMEKVTPASPPCDIVRKEFKVISVEACKRMTFGYKVIMWGWLVKVEEK